MKTWLMMGLIVVGLIGFVIYTTIRDKKKNKTSRKDYNNLMSDANIKRDELMMELLSIIKLNESDLKEFKPSIGKFPMSTIVNKSKILVTNLKNSKAFATAIKLEINNLELTNIFEELLEIRSNHWNKKCKDVLTMVEEYVNKFVDVEYDNKVQYLAVLKRYRKIWDEIKV